MTRVVGAALAFVASALLVIALVSQAWWDGPLRIGGHAVGTRVVHIGPFGSEGCYTDTGACVALGLGGQHVGFGAAGVLVAIAGIVVALGSAVAGLGALQRRTWRRKLPLLAASAVALGGAVLYTLLRPAVDVPLGYGAALYAVGAIAAAVASVVVNREPAPSPSASPVPSPTPISHPSAPTLFGAAPVLAPPVIPMLPTPSAPPPPPEAITTMVGLSLGVTGASASSTALPVQTDSIPVIGAPLSMRNDKTEADPFPPEHDLGDTRVGVPSAPSLPPPMPPRPTPKPSAPPPLPPRATPPSSIPSIARPIAHQPSPACPQCDAPMAWNETHLRFFCRACRVYF